MPQLFGEKLRYLRSLHHLSQAELGRHLGGYSRFFISNLEAGRKGPRLEHILQIARVFGVTLDYLLRDTIPAEQSGPTHVRPQVEQVQLSIPHFSEQLRSIRLQLNLTQEELAQQLGLGSRSHLTNLERGRRTPSIELIIRIADFLQISIDQLLEATVIERKQESW